MKQPIFPNPNPLAFTDNILPGNFVTEHAIPFSITQDFTTGNNILALDSIPENHYVMLTDIIVNNTNAFTAQLSVRLLKGAESLRLSNVLNVNANSISITKLTIVVDNTIDFVIITNNGNASGKITISGYYIKTDRLKPVYIKPSSVFQEIYKVPADKKYAIIYHSVISDVITSGAGIISNDTGSTVTMTFHVVNDGDLPSNFNKTTKLSPGTSGSISFPAFPLVLYTGQSLYVISNNDGDQAFHTTFLEYPK